MYTFLLTQNSLLKNYPRLVQLQRSHFYKISSVQGCVSVVFQKVNIWTSCKSVHILKKAFRFVQQYGWHFFYLQCHFALCLCSLLHIFINVCIYLFIYLFIFPLYSMGTKLNIHVYVIFPPIVMLWCKYPDIVLSATQQYIKL